MKSIWCYCWKTERGGKDNHKYSRTGYLKNKIQIRKTLFSQINKKSKNILNTPTPHTVQNINHSKKVLNFR